MLENQTASYAIEITKSGDGAEQQTQAFKTLEAEIARLKKSVADLSAANGTANNSSTRVNSGFAQLANSTRTVTAGMSLLKTAAMQVGFAALPELTFAASTAAHTINQLRQSGVETKAGWGVMAGGIAGVAALAFTATEAWMTYDAEQKAVASDRDMIENLKLNADKLRELSKTAREEGKITVDEYQKLLQTLKRPSDTGNQAVREFITKRDTPGAQEQIADFERQAKYTATTNEGFNVFTVSPTNLVEQQKTLNAVYAERIALFERLRAEGAITDKQAADMGSDADINRMQAVNAAESQRISKLKEYQSLRSEITSSTLSGVAQEKAVEVDRYNAEIQKIRELAAALGLEKTATEQVEQAAGRAHAQKMEQIKNQRLGIMSLEDMEVNAAQSFSSGFANAFVSFVNGTKSAEDAFKQFAASFLTQIAEMIIQQIILNALKSVLFGGGGTATAASGGSFAATYAANGVQSVSRPTYFPKFNVVAGEAGREMLTVLAKPRMMEIGGVESVVGMAGSKRLAISDADQLASRGGGMVDIRVHMEPGLRAEIVDESISGARVRVANDMQNDTPISRGVKRIST